jgi:hypothetical protein
MKNAEESMAERLQRAGMFTSLEQVLGAAKNVETSDFLARVNDPSRDAAGHDESIMDKEARREEDSDRIRDEKLARAAAPRMQCAAGALCPGHAVPAPASSTCSIASCGGVYHGACGGRLKPRKGKPFVCERCQDAETVEDD